MDFHRIKNIVQTEHTLHTHEWKGAVLFLCDSEYVYFIKRSEKMPTHGGQIAFFGGHKTAEEETPWITVQREFEEETSVSRREIEFLGYLPIVMTAHLQPIVPVLARLLMPRENFLKEVRSNGEWVEMITYTWQEIIREENWEYAWRNGFIKSPIFFHTIQTEKGPHLLWGATAAMVWDFLRLYFK